MTYRTVAVLPAFVCVASLCGCSSEVDKSQATLQSSEDLASCPAVYPNDAQARAAASIAFGLMKLAALEAQSGGNLLAARSILAPQRYRLISGSQCDSSNCYSGGIEFDPSDPLYPHVTDAMKAELAFGQLDASEGAYLAGGLNRGLVSTDGQLYPSIFAIPSLAQFSPNVTATVHLADSTSEDNSHYATLKGSPWCGALDVSIGETVNKSWAYAPLAFNDITDWRPAPATFKGTGPYAHEPTTPFNGKDGQNPYVLVSINGTPQHWAYETFTPVNCWDNPWPTFTCASSMEIDPIPYAQSGDIYDANGNLVGPQPNPFGILGTMLYADPSHALQWGTRTVNGIQEWGTFSQPVTLFGTTLYKFVVQD